jgi:hypothetical protein
LNVPDVVNEATYKVGVLPAAMPVRWEPSPKKALAVTDELTALISPVAVSDLVVTVRGVMAVLLGLAGIISRPCPYAAAKNSRGIVLINRFIMSVSSQTASMSGA